MRLFKLFLAATIVAISTIAHAQILTFEFSSLTGSEATAGSNSNDPNLGSSTISRGAGLTASNNGGRYNATSWAVTSIANAVSGNDYMEFTISPNAGYQFSVSSIYIQLQRSGTGPSAIALRSSVDGYTSNLDTEYSITDNTSTQNFTFTFTQSNSTSPVTYRVYMYAESTGGSGGIGDGAGDDIIVYGTVSSTGGSPAISVSPTSLTGFSTTSGTVSASQSYTLSGSNLIPASGNITVTAPADFEVSLDNSSFSASVNVAYAGGTLSSTTVYTRIASTASAGSPSGNITNAGGGATTQIVAVDGVVTTPVTPCSELFISEYVEGSSNNKYIELYNPTSSAIDLSNYDLVQYNNGSATVSSTLALAGTIGGFGTYTVGNNSAMLFTPDLSTTSSVMGFNGNDAVALRKTGTNVDVVGEIGNASNFAADVTLRRKSTVQSGNTVYNTGEWDSFSQDEVGGLGQHTSDCFIPNPEATLSINVASGSESAGTSITLTVTTDINVTGAQTVDVELGGTGLTATDFSGVNFGSTVTVIIPNGSNQGTLSFSINDDSDVEGPETATFTIANQSSGLNIGIPASVTLDIADNDNLTSSASAIVQQGGEAATIPSITNGTISNSSQGVQVWQFRLYDGNGVTNDADSKPTVYQQFTIRQSAGNSVPAWDNVIDNVKFFLGGGTTPISGSFLVSPSTISFTPTTPINVADNGFAAIAMRITLDASLPAGTDGQHFGFSIDNSDVTVDTDVIQYSQLGTFTQTSNASLNAIDIDATLQFIDAPATVSVGSNFSITISAVDVNGNVDTDENVLVTLSQTGGVGTLSGLTAGNLINGSRTFTGLNHNTEETIQVTASAAGYAGVSATINVVDQPHQLFDDFNRTNNSTIGIPSSGGSTAWTDDALASDATRIAIDGNELYMGGCSAGTVSGSTGGTGMEQLRFDGSALYETVFDDAAGTEEWIFNMRQTRTNPSGFGASTYAAAMVLGCDENDFESATADGYAVIIGNTSTPDPVKLVRFSGGLNSNSNVTDITVSAQTTANAFYSIRVTYNPCTGVWSLYVRNDGGSAFADPTSGSLGTAVTGTDQTHTSLDLRYFGMAWQHSSSCGEFARFDNLSIPNATTTSTTAKVWNGSVSTDWNVASNWGPCPGVPTATDDVEIPNVANDPIIGASPAAECLDLTVATGAVLTIQSGNSLTVNGALSNNGNVIVRSGGSLVQTVGSTLVNTGSFQVQRQGTTSGSVYNYWSSPVQTGTVPGNSAYSYNSNLSTQDYGDDQDPDPGWQAFSGTMAVGRGYASRGGGLASFVGTVNNGDVPVALTYHPYSPGNTNAGTPFNLVGNPYPSAISAADLLSTNTDVYGSVYLWDDDFSGGTGYTSSDYAIWNFTGSVATGPGGGGNTPSGFIASGQGFMIRAMNSSAVLNFSNSMRVAGQNNAFFKPAQEEPKLWLSLSGNGDYNEILIGILEDATDGEDRLYDAVKLRGGSGVSLAATDAGNDYAIMAFPPTFSEKVVPLSVVMQQAGNYTFTPHTMQGFDGYQVWLEDRRTQQWHALSENAAISKNLPAGEITDRFYLHFRPLAPNGIDNLIEEHVAAYFSDGLLRLVSSVDLADANIQVLAADGRMVFSEQRSLGAGIPAQIALNEAKGTFVLRVSTTDRVFVKRFVNF